MADMHRLLQRQMKRYLGNLEALPVELQPFLNAVNDAYWQADADRQRLEHTLTLSSQELLTANSQLQTLLSTVESQVAQRTAELTQANADLEIALQELKQAQAQLIQTEKMSSLGQLVAGVAHEINNPIGFIQGNLSYLNRYATTLLHLIQLYQTEHLQPSSALQQALLETDFDFLAEDLVQILNSMQMGTDRITEIVQSLQTFSRVDQSDRKPIDLHAGIESTLLILRSRLKPKHQFPPIEVIKAYGELPEVECYGGKINQVFMNILANAIDALEECSKFQPVPSRSGGSSPDSIGFSESTLDSPLPSLPTDRPAHWPQSPSATRPSIWIYTRLINPDWIEVRILDNGDGIRESVRSRLFDPFFTTKPAGKGTGLGLAISYQIVTEHHQGQITCHSIVGIGTEFVVQIPVRQRSLQTTAPA